MKTDEARTHGNIDGQYVNSGISGGRERGGGSDTLRTSIDQRGGSRWGDILVGVLTALTTFLLIP